MTAAFVDTNEENQKLILRWTAAGHEVIHDRMVFRHKAMKKDLPPDTLVKYNDGTPIISCGKPVHVGDMLPERVDIALDSDGKLVGQQDFERRYREYARWFQYIEGTDVDVEPVPDPVDFVLATPDTFSESNGFVQINFDARVPAPERTHMYDPLKDELVEIKEVQATSLEAIKAMLEQMTSTPERRGPGRPRKDE